jgi:hypothetical protein
MLFLLQGLVCGVYNYDVASCSRWGLLGLIKGEVRLRRGVLREEVSLGLHPVFLINLLKLLLLLHLHLLNQLLLDVGIFKDWSYVHIIVDHVDD